MAVEIGQEAPDFELRATTGGTIKLSDYRGEKNVLLIFYPFAFSRVCTSEFCGLRDDNSDLASDDQVEVLGISCDSAFVLKAWKKAEGFPNEFVADYWPHGKVSDDYGVFIPQAGCPKRGTFLIDTDGILRWMEVSEDGSARDQSGWRAALAELGVQVAAG